MTIPKVKIHILPGGQMPQRFSAGAIGFDVYLRVLVSPDEMDPENPVLRKTLFDFTQLSNDQKMAKRVKLVDKKDGIDGEKELVYDLRPGESVLVGIGFVTEMPFPMFYWIAPRSGLASKHRINITNAPGTVDPDYRGEAGVIVENRHRTKSFELRRGMRIAQILFQEAIIPDLLLEENYDNLESTKRGAGGFGSTGGM